MKCPECGSSYFADRGIVDVTVHSRLNKIKTLSYKEAYPDSKRYRCLCGEEWE